MFNSAHDHGYLNNTSRCVACGSTENYCCDGSGHRLMFDDWAHHVDSEICMINGTEDNTVTAPYAEMYMDGLTVAQAVEKALA